MAQYKCVPGPKNLVVEDSSGADAAVRSFADIINREATGGWDLHSLEEIVVTTKPGCLAGLLGKKAEQVSYNMLVFVKQ